MSRTPDCECYPCAYKGNTFVLQRPGADYSVRVLSAEALPEDPRIVLNTETCAIEQRINEIEKDPSDIPDQSDGPTGVMARCGECRREIGVRISKRLKKKVHAHSDSG